MFPRAPLPERIGPYRVVRRLPSSGAADQYLGREEGPLGFSREVLLKLAPSGAEDPLLADELAREAAAVARLNHPGVVRMLSFFQHEDRLVLVMERVDGASLGRVMQTQRRRKQPLPESVVFHVAHRLVSSIAAAHAMTDELGNRTPIVHRAIHPGVVICGWDGSVRLSGFGLAKIVGRTPDTAVGMVKGTPGYMAPEQLRGERVTERADVYQAGLVMWEMLAGEPPPSAQTDDPAMMMQRLEGTRMRPISEVRPSVPREVAAVIDAALEPNVDKRTITCAEIERWLSRTTDVDGGKEQLRERVVALRSAAVRTETPQDTGRQSLPPRVARPRRGSLDRFPSQAVRATGRPSAFPEGEAPPPSRRIEPAPRSSRPAPASKRPSASLSVPRAPALPRFRTSASGAPPPSLPTVRQSVSAPPASIPPSVSPTSVAPAGPWGPPIATPRTTRPPPPSVSIASPPLGSGTTEPWVTVGGDGDRAADTQAIARLRPKNNVLAIVIAGGSILVVLLVISLVVFGRRAPVPPSDAAPAATRAPSASSPPVSSPPPAVATTSAPVSAAPTASAPTLGPGFGALLVHGMPGNVYVNGVSAGPIEETLTLPCGRRYIRVGVPPEPSKQTRWLSKGTSAAIPCGSLVEVTVLPLGSDMR